MFFIPLIYLTWMSNTRLYNKWCMRVCVFVQASVRACVWKMNHTCLREVVECKSHLRSCSVTWLDSDSRFALWRCKKYRPRPAWCEGDGARVWQNVSGCESVVRMARGQENWRWWDALHILSNLTRSPSRGWYLARRALSISSFLLGVPACVYVTIMPKQSRNQHIWNHW